jgi:hypothetical protein
MRNLVLATASALIVLCGGTIGADVTHPTSKRPSPGANVPAVALELDHPVAAPPSAARLGSCVVPETTVYLTAAADRTATNSVSGDIIPQSIAQVSRNDKVDVTL